MSSLVIKIIAIISMLLDHTGYLIFDKFTFLNYIGRIAFPLFALGISEGYMHTHNLKKYFLRLIIFAIISQVPYMLFRNYILNADINFNIMFTLVLGLLAITVYDKVNNKYLGLLLVALLCIISNSFYFDYGWFGVAIIFIFYIFKENKILLNISFSIAAILNYIFDYVRTSNYTYLLIILFCCLALIPINLYNGKKGKDIKYLFYLFYPLHLILLVLLNFIF